MRSLCVLLAAGLLASCSSAGTNTSIAPIVTTNTEATLQLSVGTLNDSHALLDQSAGTYLNVVSSFRNPTGTSAFFHPGTAILTGPGGLSLKLGSLWAYGQSAGANGTLGEPPAFSPQNLVGGYSTGYILTGSPATPGVYTVATTVSFNGQTQNFSATATLPQMPTVLGPEPLPVWSSDGNGGGTFTMSNPSGAIESVVFVQAQSGAYVASMELKSPATSVAVPDGTLTTGTTYYVFALGADYPMIESAPPNSLVPNPTLTGAGRTADLTASNAATITE